MAAMDRRRFLGLAGGLGLGAAALAACGGPQVRSNARPQAVVPVDYSGVKPASSITMWTSNPGGSQQVTQQIIDAFHASQPDVHVELVTAGATYEDIAQRFQAAQTGGTLPDLLVVSDVWWFRYYMLDSIIPLNSLVESVGIETSDYRSQLLADYQYKDGQWAIPWARSTPLFYYNKSHWQAAGLPDRGPATWEEFAEWAPRLSSANADVQHPFELPALADYAGWTFQNNLWGWGGGWSADNSFDITCDSDATVAALQFIQDSVYRGRWAAVASSDSTNELVAGATSATTASTGSLVTILKSAKFDVGAARLPGGPAAATPVCPTGGAGVAVPRGRPMANQVAAGMFLKFLTSPENTVLFSQATGYIPVRTSADTSALTAKTPQTQVAIDQLGVTRTQGWARVFLPGADAEMANACADMLTQRRDVADTMKDLRGTLQQIYTLDVSPNL